MNPQDLHSLPCTKERHRHRSAHTVTCILAATDGSNEPFARCAQQDRASKSMENRNAAQQDQIVFERLSKANPRINNDLILGDSSGNSYRNAFRQKVIDVL